MSNQIDIRAYVEGALQARRFAVLATERDGQPHSSLIAITPICGARQLIFATYRGTRTYRNLTQNGKVAVFIDDRDENRLALPGGFVLTALGHAQVVSAGENAAVRRAHLERHPDLESFLGSLDCTLIRVTVDAYQVVGAIDDVRWWRLDEPAGD